MPKYRKIYTGLLTFLAISIVLYGIILTPTYDDPFTLILLLFVAIGAHTTTTNFVSGNMNISVGGAISFAAIGLYDPIVAGMVAALSEFGIWLIKVRSGNHEWRAEFERLGANAGMQAISVSLAGLAYIGTSLLLNPETILGKTVPWMVAGVIGDQVNFWLLAVIIYMVHGIKPSNIWRENRWAVPMKNCCSTCCR